MDKQYSEKEIEAILSAITGGEWSHSKSGSEYLDGRPAEDYEVIASGDHPEGLDFDFVAEAISSEADAKFIAAAPAIIRQLLARVKELETSAPNVIRFKFEIGTTVWYRNKFTGKIESGYVRSITVWKSAFRYTVDTDSNCDYYESELFPSREAAEEQKQ